MRSNKEMKLRKIISGTVRGSSGVMEKFLSVVIPIKVNNNLIVFPYEK